LRGGARSRGVRLSFQFGAISNAPAPLTLRQVDPLIRQLSLYRDVIEQRNKSQPQSNKEDDPE